ncbi:hypothetical protein H5S09_08245 [Limosilactobacillus sp. STM2_1]|uniref:Uncharacterized protein n=1 Tax=Limosilactobacillus rudii TaxID=2759755 RepID=A0A7W3YN98_9LACO|nr:hypothetical protein [Limosilactobacillus rudii]MBB1079845.1 hypothetical protein [Limosilactobacillus rudii]MBB1097923.1 hypothetical protein [Limosilactobacillus rudii]MCD7134992.1 hypothetical protein [Limosilactobacillus rudii]
MTTRSELRAQREEAIQATSAEQNNHPQHHIIFRLWGIICLILMLLSILLNSTLLNASFVKDEITNSSLESLMLNQINSSLTQYGISTSVLKKSDTDKLITQAVDQVYAGEKINLDLSTVVNSVNDSVNSQLAQYGLSTSMLPANGSSAITSNINSMVNSQLNTPEVTQVISEIKLAKGIANAVLVISLLSLIILIIKGIWQHHVLSSFSWICLIGGILYTGVLMAIHGIAIQVGQQQPDLSPFIVQVADAFQQRGFNYSLLTIGFGIVLFILQFGKRRWQERR